MSRVVVARQAIVRWWTTPVPLARIAALRAAIYLFLLYDIWTITDDAIPLAYSPEFYQPKLIGRILPLPTPTVEMMQVLQVVIIVGALVAASGLLPRLAGWIVALAYMEWLVVSMGYAYVDHDHMALVIAVFVLPTVGRARFTDRGSSEAAGWALRCIQVAVIATYFCSAIVKTVRSGSPATWANGAVFVWALTRRGSDMFRWATDYPWLLQIAQWGVLTIEFLSPVVLFLRARALYLAIVMFLGFHLVTFLALGIHFLPTVVCWLAFVPLEQLIPLGQRLINAIRQRQPHSAALP